MICDTKSENQETWVYLVRLRQPPLQSDLDSIVIEQVEPPKQLWKVRSFVGSLVVWILNFGFKYSTLESLLYQIGTSHPTRDFSIPNHFLSATERPLRLVLMSIQKLVVDSTFGKKEEVWILLTTSRSPSIQIN